MPFPTDDDLRRAAAESAGLPPELGERLHGSTVEELTADAERLAESFDTSEEPDDAFVALNRTTSGQ